MTMRITMIQSRLGESGSVLAAGTTNTVSDAFGAAMVGARYATDTDLALKPAKTDYDAATAAGVQSLVAGGGLLEPLRASDSYFYGFWGDGHVANSARMYDLSGALNDGVAQAGISAATLWASAPVATIPKSAGTTGLVELPAMNFDYAGGQSLIIMFRGSGTPPGSGNMPLFGDVGDGTATYKQGWYIRTSNTGQTSIALRDSAAVGYFGGNDATALLSATEQTFGWVLDGATKTYCHWFNGARTSAFSGAALSFASGTSVDTISGRTVKIGGDGRVVTSVQDGVALNVRALHIFRIASGGVDYAGLDAAMLAFHRRAQRLISAAAI